MATKDEEIVVPDEGELAADYLESLLDIADLDGDIEFERLGCHVTSSSGGLT